MKKNKCLVCKEKETTECGLFCKKCLKEADVFVKVEAIRKSGRHVYSRGAYGKYQSRVMQRFEEERKASQIALKRSYEQSQAWDKE